VSKGIDFVNPTPLYEQIIGDIRNLIARGELQPGDKLPTHQELAEKYRVSLITVKSALKNLVKEQVLYTRVGKGTYVADQSRKKGPRPDEKMLGLVLRDLKQPFFSMVVHSVEKRASELGYHLVLSSSMENIDREETQIERFRDLGVQGLIIASLSYQYRATEHIERLHRDNFPYVMVSYIHDPAYWYVGCDQEEGGVLATEHLISIGYRSIGFVHIGKGNLLSDVRKNGYARALAEHEIPYSSDLIYYVEPQAGNAGTDRYQLGYAFARKFAGISRKPEALFFYNDMVALGFIQGALESGIRVPDDVGVVGFDDVQVAGFASVPLTTIHQPVDKIGKWAVDIVNNRINREDMGNRIILRPTLVVRESCGARKRGLAMGTRPSLEGASSTIPPE
jgi:GntR family transcriptional regulator, arabinose operon transcriptional repressor